MGQALPTWDELGIPAKGGSLRRPSPDLEHLDPRQRLALQLFEEGAASGRHIGEPRGRAGGIERRDRVTAPCHRYNLPGGGEFRRRFGDLDRADVERFELEGAERPVPDQRLDPGEHGADTLDAARADVQDHLIATHDVHRDHARTAICPRNIRAWPERYWPCRRR